MGFIDDIKSSAINIYQKYGVLPSITISQAVLESGSGTSGLAKKGNNLFGIKGSGTAGSIQMPTKEVIDGKTVNVLADFRAYNNWGDSIEDYGKLLGTSKRYSGVVGASGYKESLVALGNSGYATDPNYASKLGSIIETNKLYNIDNEVAGNGAKWYNPTTWDLNPFDGKQPATGDGSQGYFNLSPDSWATNIDEWLKSISFSFVGIMLLILGAILLFGIGRIKEAVT